MTGEEPYDPDVVAYIYAVDELCSGQSVAKAIRQHNSRLQMSVRRGSKGHVSQSPETESSSSSEGKANDAQQSNSSDTTCFKVTFSNLPKRPGGFVFGYDEKLADFVIERSTCLSGRHFALTFDKDHELVIKDLRSTHGTKVVYANRHTEGRNNIKEVEAKTPGMVWSACGPPLTKGAPVKIMTGNVGFRLVVPPHDKTSVEYLKKIDSFLQGQPEDVVLGDMSLLSRPHTVGLPAAGSDMPSSGTLFWRKKLGSGGFAKVDYAWNVTTREVCAIKQPKEAAFDATMWKNEAALLKQCHHPNIIRLLKAELNDVPELYLEYAPCGSLNSYISTSTTRQNKQIAVQLLSALVYMHETRTSLAHRDIKPENVLVFEWTADRIHVKLGDFGVAKAIGKGLAERVGTPYYRAPEIANRSPGQRYGTKVDVWSLGALLGHLECHCLPQARTPDCDSPTPAEFVEFVRQHNVVVNDAHSLFTFILDYMLQIDPDKRSSSKECLCMANQRFKGDLPEADVASHPSTTIQEGLAVEAGGVIGRADGVAMDSSDETRTAKPLSQPMEQQHTLITLCTLANNDGDCETERASVSSCEALTTTIQGLDTCGSLFLHGVVDLLEEGIRRVEEGDWSSAGQVTESDHDFKRQRSASPDREPSLSLLTEEEESPVRKRSRVV
ncbi:hypothetical protein MY11210_005969 [Beauveria gryllotalpidicola]